MRLLAVACLALVVAGCSGAPSVTSSATSFAPTCPNWVVGRNSSSSIMSFAPSDNTTHREDDVSKDFLTFDGHPLDQIELVFGPSDKDPDGAKRGVAVEDGALTMTMRRADDGSPLMSYRTDLGNAARMPVWQFNDRLTANFTIHIDLTQPNAAVRPSAVTVSWDFQRNMDGNDTTPSDAAASYHYTYYYRTCNADGTPAS